METKMADKSANILAIEGSSPARQLLLDEIKRLGFAKVQGVPSIKDAIEILEIETIDWIITPLFYGRRENALALLKAVTSTPHLRDVRVSFLLEEDEVFCLGTAFELGLLSWHTRPFTSGSLKAEFANLLKSFESNNWNSCLTSAGYLRDWLREHGDYAGWIAFERKLLRFFPQDASLLLGLAEPLMLSGQLLEAQRTILQAQMIDNALENRVKELTERLDSLKKEQQVEVGETPIVGVESVLLVDPDVTVQKTVQDILVAAGVKEIAVFGDGQLAFEWLKEHPNPGLIIQEWRIPQITGPLFLQRLVQMGNILPPIIILSSLVNKGDIPLIEEMGVANIMTKPVSKEHFLQTLIWTTQQNNAPTEQVTIERRIIKLFNIGNKKEAQELLQQYLTDDTVPRGKKKFVESLYAYYKTDYIVARDLCIEAIKATNSNSMLTLNLLGKILMQLRDFQAALKAFEKAQSLSPLNIERLCIMAEAQNEMGATDKANDLLKAASDIDAGSPKIEETELRMAISFRNIDRAKELMKKLDSLENFVAYMNNKAVAFARCGMFKEGVDQYKDALQSLPHDKSHFASIIHYNLALAFIRSGNLAMAKEELEKSLANPHKRIKDKGNSLLNRLSFAITTQKEFHLIETHSTYIPTADENSSISIIFSADEEDIQPSENDRLIAEISIEPGIIGCYLIFFNHIPMDPKSVELLRHIPSIVPRDTITRGETAGADKTFHAETKGPSGKKPAA